MLFEPLKGPHELESSAVLTRMMDLLVVLSVWCDNRYKVCHLEFAFMLLSMSIYSSCSKSRSQSLCTGELIRSRCTLSDLFKFCCHILNLIGVGSTVYDIKESLQEAGRCQLFSPPTCMWALVGFHWCWLLAICGLG